MFNFVHIFTFALDLHFLSNDVPEPSLALEHEEFRGIIMFSFFNINFTITPKIFINFFFQKYHEDLSSEWRNEQALKLIRDIYKCNYKSNVTAGYLKHMSKSENQFLLRHNGRVWKSCTSLLPSNVACFMPKFLSNVCPLFPTRFRISF